MSFPSHAVHPAGRAYSKTRIKSSPVRYHHPFVLSGLLSLKSTWQTEINRCSSTQQGNVTMETAVPVVPPAGRQFSKAEESCMVGNSISLWCCHSSLHHWCYSVKAMIVSTVYLFSSWWEDSVAFCRSQLPAGLGWGSSNTCLEFTHFCLQDNAEKLTWLLVYVFLAGLQNMSLNVAERSSYGSGWPFKYSLRPFRALKTNRFFSLHFAFCLSSKCSVIQHCNIFSTAINISEHININCITYQARKESSRKAPKQ